MNSIIDGRGFRNPFKRGAFKPRWIALSEIKFPHQIGRKAFADSRRFDFAEQVWGGAPDSPHGVAQSG